MDSLKPAFDRAKAVNHGLDLFTILLWIIAIDEDRQQRERQKKKRRERQAQQVCPPRKPAGPRPF